MQPGGYLTFVSCTCEIPPLRLIDGITWAATYWVSNGVASYLRLLVAFPHGISGCTIAWSLSDRLHCSLRLLGRVISTAFLGLT